MSGLGIYDLENVSYSVDLEDIEETGSKYYIAGSESYNQKFVPESIAPKIEGTRQVNLGYIGDGEWVLLKSGADELEDTAVSHIGAQAVLEDTELNFPKMDYSEGQLIIEHLGDLESPISALNQDTERYEDLIEAIAGKAILGDNDLGGNIGFVDGEFYVYDFDRAGSAITAMEGSVYDYIRRIDRLTEVESSLEDVERSMENIAWSLELSELESKFDFLLCSIDQRAQRRCARLEAEDFIYNIERVRDGEYFNTGLKSMMEDTNHDETRDMNDTLKQNIREAMLD